MFTTRPTLQGSFGMAASSHWLATAAAMAVLEDGGNAFDAAVAAGFTLQVVEPHMNGPAGEVPIILAPAGGRPQVLCGQGGAPAAATIGHYTSLGLDEVPGTGPLAATVPGAFDAWLLLLRDHGTKHLSEVLRYAIGCAAHGYPALPAIGAAVEAVRTQFERHWPSSAALYLPHGRPPAPGALLRNPELAATWERLLAEAKAAGAGREQQIEAARRVWRQGFVAAALTEFAARPSMDTSGVAHAGVLTGDDLAAFEATYEEPVSYEWRGWTVCKPGLWSQGPVFLQQLALLPDGFGQDGPVCGGPAYLHALIEGGKLAMADREAWYGDNAELTGVTVADLLDPAYSIERRSLIGEFASAELRPGRPGGRLPRLGRRGVGAPRIGESAVAPGTGEPNLALPSLADPSDQGIAANGATKGDTCHLDVVDRWGNMVSATPSGGWLQSSPVVPGLGFPLGTRLQMAQLEPGLPNSLSPGRRPRTTLSPSLALREGEPVLAFGTPGGDAQDQWSLHFFLAVALRPAMRGGLDLQGAIDAANWHQESFPSSFHPHAMHPALVTVEARVGDAVIAELRRRRHRVRVAGAWSEGRVCAVARDPRTGLLTAAADPRGSQAYAAGR